MTVRVDQACSDVHPFGVDDMSVFIRLQFAADLLYFAVDNQKVVFFEHTTLAACP